VHRVKLLREDNARVRYLTDDEEARLRYEIGDPEWPVVAIALNTGLRRAVPEGLATYTCSFGAADVSGLQLVGTRGSLRLEPAYEFVGGASPRPARRKSEDSS
jgi:hypothetical protein